MEVLLRAALIAWLTSDPALAVLNSVTEEVPLKPSAPWLAIAASASVDWSTKDAAGREVRIALELHCRGDAPGTAADLVTAIEARVAGLPRTQAGFSIAGTQFLRARAELRDRNTRAILLEYRFRVLAG